MKKMFAIIENAGLVNTPGFTGVKQNPKPAYTLQTNTLLNFLGEIPSGCEMGFEVVRWIE